jgi:hypothetical protein
MKYSMQKLTGLAAIAGTGAVSVLHTLSHLVPALAVLEGASHTNGTFMESVSHPSFGIAYVAFVPLSIYYAVKETKQNAIYKAKISELEQLLEKKE